MKKYITPAITIEKLNISSVIATSGEDGLKVHVGESTNSVQADERKGNPIWD